MENLPFFYKDQDTTFTADRCNSLINAVEDGKIHLRALTRDGYPGDELNKTDLPGILPVGHWDAAGKQDWGLATHRNEGIELTFLERGKLDFRANDRDYTLKPGDITIARPWQPHSLGKPNISSCRLHWVILDVQVRQPHNTWQWPDWLILTEEDRDRLTTLLSHNETPVWRANKEIKSCVIQIAKVLQAKDETCKISRLALLINHLFLSVLEMLSNNEITLEPELSSTQRTVELFLESLRNNNSLLGQQWNATTMSKHCEVGLTRFYNLCQKTTNMTPIQYLNFYRIEMATEMLKNNPDLTVTKTAFACGFNSSQYFATAFKQQKGCSPRDYRK